MRVTWVACTGTCHHQYTSTLASMFPTIPGRTGFVNSDSPRRWFIPPFASLGLASLWKQKGAAGSSESKSRAEETARGMFNMFGERNERLISNCVGSSSLCSVGVEGCGREGSFPLQVQLLSRRSTAGAQNTRAVHARLICGHPARAHFR